MSGYAVVDVETTGLLPGMHHRVVEVAVVHLDVRGAVTGEWCSLLNPQRDLGPQRIHRITAAEVRGAPTFDQIAAELAGLLAGRVVVAHNLSFDLGFLSAEFDRTGVAVPLAVADGLCTMELAETYLDSPSRSLAACCRAAGVPLEHAHSALHDAHAAAGLLAAYLARCGRPEPWSALLSGAVTRRWPVFGGGGRPPVRRGRAVAGTEAEHFLARLVDNLPRVHQPTGAEPYLAVLDKAMLDRYLSLSEQDELVAVAAALGLDRAAVEQLHRGYLEALAVAARRDGWVNESERAELRDVAAMLGLPGDAVTQAFSSTTTQPRRGFRLRRGDRVVFTGETMLPREEWEEKAVRAGLVVRPDAVSGRTRLVVAADPDTLSGKARQARERGIPVITETAFHRLLATLDREE
ncbi:exonuclease domain-containing protein [Allokutzneria oryzae]|uniref:Exonuclease domain-containing protein n=1 Tax=Allokutzneria oryzae TaxID=1378989 RepID=A0ABV6A4S6_9PSEU